MRFSRNLIAGTLGLALVSTSFTPAMARGYGSIGVGSGWGNGWGGVSVGSAWGGGRGWGRRHRGGDDDTGEVLGGVLIGAILTGVILSSAKKKKEREQGYPSRDGRVGDGRVDDRDQRWENSRDDRSNDRSGRRGDIATEDQAVDACAMAAEAKAGRTASVRDISNVRSSSDGWDVEGVVESRDGWRDRSMERRDFTCSVRLGAVDSVYVEDAKIAAR